MPEGKDSLAGENLEAPVFAAPQEPVEDMAATENLEAPVFAASQEHLETPHRQIEKEEDIVEDPKVRQEEPVCNDENGNCAECCAIFTDEELRAAFGYQEEEATCQCHDICVPDVKLICVEELEHEIPIPGIDSVIGCRGGRQITGQLTLESCRVFCADETLVQEGPNACLQVNNEVGLEIILSIEVAGETVFLVVRDTIELVCNFTDFHEFPSGAGFEDDDDDRERFREIIKFIDGSCKTIIIESCEIENTDNPRVVVALKVIDKLWKHENLLVSAIRPYPENITVKREFNAAHEIGPCNQNG